MNFRNLDLNLLVALDALLTERSVTRAGERIFRTQPATSGILARLRLYFNDELLIRVGNTIETTPLAEQLIPALREFLSIAQHIADLKPSMDPIELEQLFVLTMSDYAADFILPELLKTLSIEAPNVRVRIRTMDYKYGDALESRETDFVILPPQYAVGQGPIEPVLTDRWVCIADRTRHKSDTLTLESFSSASFVAVNYYDGRTQTTFERQFSEAGLNWSTVATVPYFQMLPRLISGSDNLAVIHARTAQRDAATFGLKVLEIPLALEPLKLCLCAHERASHSQPHKWMAGVIRRVCADVNAQVVPAITG